RAAAVFQPVHEEQEQNWQPDRERADRKAERKERWPRRIPAKPHIAPGTPVDDTQCDGRAGKRPERLEPRLRSEAHRRRRAEQPADHRLRERGEHHDRDERERGKNSDAPGRAQRPAFGKEDALRVHARERVNLGPLTAAAMNALTKSSAAKGVTPAAIARGTLPPSTESCAIPPR